MKIEDLKVGMGKVDIEAEIISIEEPRTFMRNDKEGRVTKARIKDDTGEFTLTLWNKEIDMVKEGVKIKIKNGYVSEFQGEPQLSAGKFGKLEVIE